MSTATTLEVDGLVKHFKVRQSLFQPSAVVHAVDDVTLKAARGTTLGIVGESGCGKSTFARVIAGLYAATSGRILINGIEMSPDGREKSRGRVQMVFQDPSASLDPRMTALESITEALIGRNGKPRRQRALEMMEKVGLSRDFADRRPHELSGGQQQRIGLARALVGHPDLVIHDESLSALDVSLQAQMLDLLVELQEELRVTYVFISHDLAATQSISTAIAIMYLGKVVEIAPARDFASALLHPYSVALRSAIPIADPVRERARRRVMLSGGVPSALHPPSGCRFHTRCPIAREQCALEEPPLRELSFAHKVACHFPGELTEARVRESQST